SVRATREETSERSPSTLSVSGHSGSTDAKSVEASLTDLTFPNTRVELTHLLCECKNGWLPSPGEFWNTAVIADLLQRWGRSVPSPGPAGSERGRGCLIQTSSSSASFHASRRTCLNEPRNSRHGSEPCWSVPASTPAATSSNASPTDGSPRNRSIRRQQD